MDKEEPETIELPLSEFVYLIDIVEKSKHMLDSIDWDETPNEHRMIIMSDMPGGPKVLRDRLNGSLIRLENFFRDQGF
jgi:hypothetical protein